MNLGIKTECANCRENCPQKLEKWECALLFSPSREALIRRIEDLQRQIKMLEELKDIEGIKREIRKHTAALAHILRQRENQ